MYLDRQHPGLSSRSAGGAFTIVELLLSLVIIALLSSLLYLALGSVMEKAVRTSCSSNIRQIVVAVNTWSADHGDRFPLIEPDPLSQNPVYPSQANAKGILDTLKDHGVTQDLLRCRADVRADNFFRSKGTSYEWITLFDNEPRSNPRLLVHGTAISIPLSEISLVTEWSGIHEGMKNVGFADGHVEVK